MSIDCIPYINDLKVEIDILKDLKNKEKNDNSINEIDEKIREKENLIEQCKENLKKLSTNQICYRIYLKLLEGFSVNQSIAKVAHENYINNIKPATETSLYRDYYRKLKNIIKIK